MHTVAGFQALGLPAGGVGGQDLEAVAVDLLEQRRLRAGADRFAADDEPHVLRPVLVLVTTGTVP